MCFSVFVHRASACKQKRCLFLDTCICVCVISYTHACVCACVHVCKVQPTNDVCLHCNTDNIEGIHLIWQNIILFSKHHSSPMYKTTNYKKFRCNSLVYAQFRTSKILHRPLSSPFVTTWPSQPTLLFKINIPSVATRKYRAILAIMLAFVCVALFKTNAPRSRREDSLGSCVTAWPSPELQKRLQRPLTLPFFNMNLQTYTDI